jgi:hypothetical protein
MATDTWKDPAAQPAVEELLNLATATRTDINRDDLHGAITAAHTAGWTWSRTLIAVAQMLAHGETPYDLRNATLQPWQGGPRMTTR